MPKDFVAQCLQCYFRVGLSSIRLLDLAPERVSNRIKLLPAPMRVSGFAVLRAFGTEDYILIYTILKKKSDYFNKKKFVHICTVLNVNREQFRPGRNDGCNVTAISAEDALCELLVLIHVFRTFHTFRKKNNTAQDEIRTRETCVIGT